jgi:hypothetical protein
MANKTCGECRYYHPIFEHEGVCIATSDLHKTCDFTSDCAIGGFNPKPSPTNGDKIRQMSNEELATWGMYDLGTCPTFEKRQTCPKRGECSASEVEDCWRDWLNAPAESEVNNG